MILKVFFSAFRDFFDKRVFFISLVPLIISAIFWSIVFYIFHNDIDVLISEYVENEDIRGFFLFVLESIVFYELLIITSVIIVGIVADKIVKTINQKYYKLNFNGFGKISDSIFISIKANIKFVLIFIFLFLPSLVIFPFISLVIHILMWMVVIKDAMFYDSLSSIANENEYNIIKNSNRLEIFFITLLSASLFFIPVFGVFVYIWQLLIFIHYNLNKLKELR